MSLSHEVQFKYNNWSVSRDVHSDYVAVSSNGTARKTSERFPISKVIGTITASVTGGFGWCAAYKDYDQNYDSDSLYVNLTVNIYLVARSNQRISVASATGSASRSGFLDEFSVATTRNLTFDTSTITDEQRSLYDFIEIEYTCITSKSSGRCDKVGDFNNGNTANPTGTATITIRDTINVDYDGTEMTNLYYNGNEMSGLTYDGNVIF